MTMATDAETLSVVADLAEAGTPSMLESLSALPDDVRAIVVERALAELRERGQVDESFDPTPGNNPDGERARMQDITATDRSRVIVFSMLDGEPHEILRIDRPRVLTLRLPDNRPAFWSPGMPGRPPRRVEGKIMCRLHPNSPERAEVDALGFEGRFCNDGDRSKEPRSNFRNVVDRDEHEKRKHTAFNATWLRYQDDTRWETSAAAQREQSAALMALVNQLAGQNQPASAPPKQARKQADAPEPEGGIDQL